MKHLKTPRNIISFLIVVFSISAVACSGGDDSPNEPTIQETTYFGMTAPGTTPQLFAPNKLGNNCLSITFTPDGKECLISAISNSNVILGSKASEQWNTPRTVAFVTSYDDDEPHIVPNGTRAYFGSGRPLENSSRSGLHLWYVDKNDEGWSTPQAMPEPLRDIPMMYSSVASNGNIYFTDISVEGGAIAVSRYVNGQFQNPELLTDEINSLYHPAHPFISPDESYLIFDVEDTEVSDMRDLYISFKNENGEWGTPIAFSSPVNTSGNEMCPFVSRDNKYLFFTRNVMESGGGIHWVDASVMENLR